MLMGVQFPPRAPNFAEASSRQATSIVNSKINFNSTLKGSIKIHRDGFGFFIPEDPEEKDLFIAPSHLNKALPNDVVLVRKIP